MVKNGDAISIHYTGRLNDGTVFDSSEGRAPLEFTVGSGMVIAGFDAGVMNMTAGEKKTILIPVDQAYGPKREDMIFEFPNDQIPPDMKLEPGMQLNLNGQGGEILPVTVAEVKENAVVLDGNHPLAGQDLTFDLELVFYKLIFTIKS